MDIYKINSYTLQDKQAREDHEVLYNSVQTMADEINAAFDNYVLKTGDTLTGPLNTSNITINGIEQFDDKYLKKSLGTLSSGTAYADLDPIYQDGTWHRMWRLRFPSVDDEYMADGELANEVQVSFWGRLKITLYGGWSNFNASGIMSKNITCNFNDEVIHNNVGFYEELGVNVEKDFRISEAIWNSEVNAWEILIWQTNLTGNNRPTVIIEAWANSQKYLDTVNSMVVQPVELTQDTTYTALKASSTGGTKTVTWATQPVFETPLGLEVADKPWVNDMLDDIDLTPYALKSEIPTVPTVDSALSSTSTNPVQNKVINSALAGKLSTSGTALNSSKLGGYSASYYAKASDIPTIDTELSSTSTNPVQNKVINTALEEKLGKTEKAANATLFNGYNTNHFATSSEVADIIDGTTKVSKATSAETAGTAQTVVAPLKLQIAQGTSSTNYTLSYNGNGESLSSYGTNAVFGSTNWPILCAQRAYVAATATSAAKLDDHDADYYLDYNNLTNKPTIPTVPTVSVSQTLTSGEEIGSVTVGSTTTKLYAPSGTDVDLSGYAENDGSYPDMTVGNATTSNKCAMVRYATSSSSATLTALTAAVADGMTFSSADLVVGCRVAIKFTNAHTTSSSCTLDINSTGAKTLYNSTGTSRRVQWSAGTIVEVIYDGTAWKLSHPVMYITGSTLYLS